MFSPLRRMDVPLLLSLLGLFAVGMVTLYAAVHQGDSGLWQRQAIYWLAGLIVLLGLCLLPLRLVALAAWPVYILVLLSLILVLWLGDVQMGARRWLGLGAFHVQPSEMMKWVLVLMLAHWFASREATARHLLLPALLILVPTVLIILEPDLGTALVLAAAAGIVLVLAGLSWRWLAAMTIAGVVSLPLAWHFMHDYQRRRVLTFLDPQTDPLGAGYHVIQSAIAIGSGGIFGKGYLQGTQARLHFLPEQHTDFIFAVLAEEGGLLAASLLLLLYGVMLSRLLVIAANAASRFAALLVAGITSIFTLYVVVNIGMVSGLLPVVGVPLPFVSYGGSALITMLAAVGLAMRVAIESHGKIPWQRPGNPLA